MGAQKPRSERQYTKLIEVDSSKLRKAFEKRNLSYSDIMEVSGLTKNSILNYLKRGEVSKQFLAVMEAVYNIKYDDIKPVETVSPEVVEVQPAYPVPTFDYDKLYKIIYSATYEAVKAAWKEA